MPGGEFEVAQDLLDVDGIAEILADIFAEALHGKIFIQMGERANLFSRARGHGKTGIRRFHRWTQIKTCSAKSAPVCGHNPRYMLCVARHTNFRFALITALP